MRISLAKVLKYKKRLQSEIARISLDIQSHNSVLKNAEREVDIEQSFKRFLELVDHLVTLKVKIFQANVPIYDKILRLAEAKSQIVMLKGVRVQHGLQPSSFGETPDEYQSVLRKRDIDKRCKDLENEIDKLQDELDSFNHLTEIDIPDFVL